MHKKQILRLLAAALVLFSCIVLFLPDFGVDILGSLYSRGSIVIGRVLFIMWGLFIISVFYLAFTPDAEEADTHKKRRERFERIGLVVIIACLPVQFFWPKAGSLIVLLSLAVLYWFFFWRQSNKEKGNRGA